MGATIAQFGVVFPLSTGKMWPAKGDAATAAPGLYLACTNGADGTVCNFLRSGFAQDASWSWTVGGAIYLSAAVAGGMTQTMPSTSGHQVQLLGFALHGSAMDFNPQLVTVEII